MVKKIKEGPRPTERRGFLTKIWIGLGLVTLLELAAGGISFFVSGRKEKGGKLPPLLIDAGPVTDFPPGSVTLVRPGNCYLSRLEDGGFLAISRKCTHLGCAVPWVAERKQFECPCHASVFDHTGMVVRSPAPRALDLYPITFDHDRIVIDINHPIRRANYRPEQLSYNHQDTE